jgi:hypothetical protein
LDRSVKIARSLLPSGVANLLAPFGANNTQRQLSRCLCVDTGQTGGVDRSDRSPGDSGGRPPNAPRAGSRQGDARRVALGSARPPKTPSDVAETKEEQQVVDWKSWEEIKVNTRQIKVNRFDRLDDEPQSAVALYIYRVGRSCPIRKYFYEPNLSGLLNLARNQGDSGLTGKGHRSDRCARRVDFGGEVISRSSGLRFGRYYMDFDLLDETYPMVKSK